SMSKVTSTCGTPRGAGGIPTRSNCPRSLLSAAISRSPWKTRMVTADWLSAAVEKTWLLRVGMVVFFSMSFVNTPPSVSMPSESGVTSSSRTSFTSPFSTAPWMAAPMATTSSGFTPFVRVLAEELLPARLHRRHAGHAADEDDLVDVLGADACIFERRLAGAVETVEQVGAQRLQLRPCQLHVQVPRPAGVRG